MGRARLGGDRRATGGVTPIPQDAFTKGPAHAARGPFGRSASADRDPGAGRSGRTQPVSRGPDAAAGSLPAAVDQKRLRSFIDTDCVSLEAPKVF